MFLANNHSTKSPYTRNYYSQEIESNVFFHPLYVLIIQSSHQPVTTELPCLSQLIFQKWYIVFNFNLAFISFAKLYNVLFVRFSISYLFLVLSCCSDLPIWTVRIWLRGVIFYNCSHFQNHILFLQSFKNRYINLTKCTITSINKTIIKGAKAINSIQPTSKAFSLTTNILQ